MQFGLLLARVFIALRCWRIIYILARFMRCHNHKLTTWNLHKHTEKRPQSHFLARFPPFGPVRHFRGIVSAFLMHFFLPLKAKMYSTCPRTRNYSTPHVLPLRTGFVVSALQNLTSFEVENSLPAFVRGQQIGAACLHANQKKKKEKKTWRKTGKENKYAA